MLKYFYKTFLIAVISGSLTMLQTQVAWAQVTTSTTDTSGVITTKTTHEFDKVKSSDMLASITMLAGGFITSRMIMTYKPVTTDVMIAGAAGVAFVAGEVMSNMKFKGTIDKMTVEVERKNDKTINEEQIQRLQDLKKSYEEAKSATKTKKTLQMAAAAGFGAAALTATYFAMTEDVSTLKCIGTITASKVTLAKCAASGVTANPEALMCGTCATQLTAYETVFKKHAVSRSKPNASELAKAETLTDEAFLNNPANYCTGQGTSLVPFIATKVGTACQTSVVEKISNEISTPRATIMATGGAIVKNDLIYKILNVPKIVETRELMSKKTSWFETGMNILFPRAEAGWLPLLGLGASTIAAFTLVTGQTAVEIDSLMFIPRNRAIAFGIFAGLSFAAAKSSDNVIEKINSNISKIDGILAELERQGKGVKATNVKATTLNTTGIKSGISYSTPDGSFNSPCATSNSTSNCTQLTPALSSTVGFSSLPDSLQSLATEAMKIADGVSGTSNISGATLAGAEAFGNKQAAIKKLLRKTQEEQLKKSGEKTTPEEAEGKFLNSMSAKVKKALDKKGLSAGGFMASIGSSPIDSSQSSKESVAESTAQASAVGVPEALNIGTGAGDGLKLDFAQENGVGDLAMASTGEAAPQYDMNVNDIAKENGPSIFEVISNRYLKSGYPKLLEVETAPKK